MSHHPFHKRDQSMFVASILLAFAALPALMLGAWAVKGVNAGDTEASILSLVQFITNREPPETVRGIYLSYNTAGWDTRRGEIFDMADRTEINAVVIDIKTAEGAVAYDTSVRLAKSADLITEAPYDIGEILSDARRRNLWTIARLPVFEDPQLAKRRPDLALQTRGGGFWRTNRGTAWVDPTNREVWAYAADLAKDALQRGFDEVQLDYIRFPSDGALSQVVYSGWNEESGVKKYEIIAEFFRFMRSEVGEDAYLSADLFGMTLDAASLPDNDLRIGQRLRDGLSNFDIISPMIYPSHYPPFYQGIQKPAAFPGEVIALTLDSARPFLRGDYSQIRPWLQDFNLGAIYTPDMVRAQIDEVEKRGADGWILWDPRNTYSETALRPVSESK